MNDENLDRPGVMVAVAASGTAAILVFATMPVLVGAMADRFGLDDLQSGLVATVYFSTYAVVALASPLWVRRFNWRRAALLGFALMVASLVAALSVSSFDAARLAIAATGLGAGILFPISLTLASDMPHTERVFSIKLTVEQLVPAALLIAMSLGWLIGSGLKPTLAALLATVLLCLAASFAMPRHGVSKGPITGTTGASTVPGLLGLLALAVFFAGFAGVWVFLERIAVEHGFSAEFTSLWLAVGLITSGIGPLLAAFLEDRFGQVWPVCLGTVAALASMSLLAGEVSQTTYASVLILLPLTFYFAIAYVMSIVACADNNGKIAGLMSFALAVGSASGPALFGALKGSGGPVLAAMAGCIVAGALVVIHVARQSERATAGELV
jgi:predicted MFS family arabinose efflux permease